MRTQQARVAVVGAALSIVAAALLSAAAGCAGGAVTTKSARGLLAQGKLAEACAQADTLVSKTRRRAARLEALRLWIGCLARLGRLARAERRLADSPADGAALYGRGLLAIAGSPSGLPRALELLTQAARAWPGQAEIPLRRGVILLADGRPAQALPALTRACKLGPTARCAVARAHALLDLGRRAEALVEVRQVLLRLPTRRDISRGRLLMRRVVRRNQRIPPVARALYKKAEVLLLRDDHVSSCIAYLRELLIDHPDLAPAHTLLGLAYLRQDNMARAVAAFKHASRLDRLDVRNPYYLGVIYQARHRRRMAIASYQKALALDPFLWRAAGRLGRLLGAAGQHRQAARMLDRLVVLAPGHVALRLAGRAHLAAGALERAEKHYVELLAKEPRDFEAHLRLAQILLRLHERGDSEKRAARLKAAREHAAEAASLRPTDPDVKRLISALRGK